MSDDLERRFAELAGHAYRGGQLVTAEEVRDRGERRRSRRLGLLAVLALAAVGALALALSSVGAQSREEPTGSGAGPASAGAAPAGGSPADGTPADGTPASGTPASGTPASGTLAGGTPADGTSAPAGDVLSGKREIFLLPLDLGVEKPDARLSVARDDGDRIQVTGADQERSLFVPVPSGRDTFLVRTARLRDGGEPSCWQRRTRSSAPAIVVATACDAGNKDQLWRFTELYADEQGRMLYGVHVGEEYLLWDPDGDAGLVLRRHADDELRTTFLLVDRGPADL